MELVVSASLATMNSLLGKLGYLLTGEYALVRGVRRDIQYISDELASIQAFLFNLGATSADDHDAQTKDWIRQVRDVAYDMENGLDDFLRRLPRDPRGGGCLAKIRLRVHELWTCSPRRDIAAEIADLKYRAQQVSERRIRYGVKNPEPRGMHARPIGFDAAEDQLAPTQLVGIKEPVGMDKNAKLVDWIKDKHKAGVLCICGFGGVGKTAIAVALYRKYGHQFDCRAMIKLPQGSDTDAILRSILSQVKPQYKNQMQQVSSGASYKERFGGLKIKQDRRSERDELIAELEVHLCKNRFILLIDDLWSATTLDSIRKCLPHCQNGSKIIVTTRFLVVANACHKDQTDMVHSVEALENKDAEKLFEKVVSESRSTKATQRKINENPPERIWKMCGGLPLAIVTMAGHVACNPHKTPEEWNDVCNSLFPETLDTDSRQEKPDVVNPERVTKILNYCYNDLPADVKTCSLYLSMFPKGFNISRKRLTRRWVAEGFVSERQGLSEEDVADAYFNHLVRRKIIRPVEHSSNGKVKTCQVHDMVLEYIVSKSSEENFTTVTGGHWLVPMQSSKVRRLSDVRRLSEVQRLSLQSIDFNHAKAVEIMNLSHLRSLSVFGSLDQLPSNSFEIRLVQVLDLEGCTGFKEKHIKYISKMTLLKYLSLRGTVIDKIPPSIDKLQYLETLDIRETKVEQLPRSIGQLGCISNIFGGAKMTRKALKLPEEMKQETMRSLSVLSGIEIVEGSTVLANPHNFTRLKKLVIYKLGIDKGKHYDLLSAIQYLGGYSLQSLTIDDWDSDFLDLLSSITTPPKYLHALQLSGWLFEVPKWIGTLNYLNKLTLSMTALRTDTFEVLNCLPRLFSLTFSLSSEKHQTGLVAILEKNKSDSDGAITILKEGFQSLKLLRFSAPILPLLSFSEKSMPKLEMLQLRFRMLEGLFGMDNLKNLQEVHLRIHEKAGETTSMIVNDLTSAAREFVNKPRIICDEYYDRP